ncbi:MAG: hypothetical protein STHCBS139747_001995 [Sporothrix thermara]
MPCLSLILTGLVQALPVLGSTYTITGRQLRLTWSNDTTSDGSWAASVAALDSGVWTTQSSDLGQYSVLTNFTTAAQSSTLVEAGALGTLQQFGADTVVPSGSGSGGDATLLTTTTTNVGGDAGSTGGVYTAVWAIDQSRSWDLLAVNVTWTQPRTGWVSLASPRLVDLEDSDLDWGVVPGYWSANSIETSKELFYGYVQGVPSSNWVTLESSTTSLVAIVGSRSSGTTFATVAHPSLARDPYANNFDVSYQEAWNVGMSLRGPTGTLSPTAYYPVLGKAHSQVAAGANVTARFYFSVVPGNTTTQWYEVSRFVSQEVYPLDAYDSRAVNTDALSDRIHRIHDFVTSAASLWHRWTYENLTLGAESGKLSDVASMWMVQRLTGDPLILNERLPYARNFKLAQQDTSGSVFDGAALGEYYLNGAFVSELVWSGLSTADYVSPIFTTFYLLSDVGNILLFNETDTLLRERFTLAAEKLLSWQKPAGNFDVGYLKSSPAALKYPELLDLRATWYGLLAAYRVLNDTAYLEAAERGAQWFITNAVATGRWLGVCDDTALYPDFQTAHAAGALLQLYDATGNTTYLDAAVQTARFYTLHIFNHPAVGNDDGAATKTYAGAALADWQLSQVGLNYEHAGYGGSVNYHGPITLSSHAGLFVRIYEATGDAHFLQLARLAARGRDAFVTPASGIPSYYWIQGNTGGSSYPWHGWWHIGWLTDYLVASAHMLSGGEITFAQGLMTSKVGSHVPYGFASGTIYGTAAELWQPRNLVNVSGTDSSANVDWLTARSTDGTKLFVMLLNEVATPLTATLTLDPRQLVAFDVATWGTLNVLAGTASVDSSKTNTWSVSIVGNGLTVLEIPTTFGTDPLGPVFRSYSVTGPATAPTVAWSYWIAVESWAEWAVPGSGVWTSLAASTNYTFAATLDLSSVTVDQIKIRIGTRSSTKTGISDATYWTVSA